jgi:DNA methylase
LKAGRLDELAIHPTVKPVAMIADAIKDVSHRNGIVLDLFGGSGSTLIAAHKTGRRSPDRVQAVGFGAAAPRVTKMLVGSTTLLITPCAVRARPQVQGRAQQCASIK